MGGETVGVTGKGLPKGVRGNERIAALSDGVFAIVITLLVLEIKVPQVPPAELASALLAIAPKILSHVVSFVVLGIYWVGHHNMFMHIRRHDRILLWLNILFLLCVASMPFPTGLIVQYGNERIAIIVYAATLVATGLSLDLIWWYVTRDRRLVDESMTPGFVRTVHRRVLVAPLLYALAIAVSFVSVLAAQLMFIAVALFYIVPEPLDRFHHLHLHRKSDAEE